MSASLYTSRHLGLGQQPQDIMRFRASQSIDCVPVVLTNALPVHVIVTQERLHPRSTNTLGQLKPHGTMEIDQGVLQGGDLLHFQHGNDHGENHFVTPSMEYRPHHGSITVGSIAASNGGWNRDIHPNGDISSIRMRNMLPWPIFVYHNNRKVGWIQPNKNLGSDEHGNVLAAPFIYFDDGNMGLKLGDTFQLRIDNSKVRGVPEKLYSFALTDRNISEIMIGQGNVEIGQSVKPSSFGYRLGSNDMFPRTHNAVGTDDHRSSFHRSRVPVARHKVLSGANVVSI